MKTGDILYDEFNAPTAVVIGKDENTPWTIYGERIWIAVAVASKRFQSREWGDCGALAKGLDLSDVNATLSTSSISGDEGNNLYISPNTSETNMDRCASEFVNKQNSKAKTDAILSLNANSAAAAAARSVTWAGGAFDLPRIEVLMRVHQARNRIDALDPTIGLYSDFALSNWGFGSSYGASVWSSSVSYHDPMNLAWYVSLHGFVNYYCNRYYQFGVIPVIEIPVIEIPVIEIPA